MNKPDLALNNLQWLICHKTRHRPIGLVVESSPVGRNTEVQSQVESYQRLKNVT